MQNKITGVLGEVLFGLVAVGLYAAIILAAFKTPFVVATLGCMMLFNLQAFNRMRRMMGRGVVGLNDSSGPRRLT